MPSTRNGLCNLHRLSPATLVIPVASLLLVTAAMEGGCALRHSEAAYAPKAPEPVAEVISPYRNFAPSEATYEPIGVPAWHSQFPLVPAPDTPNYARPVVEPALFVANTFILPVTALITEPLTEQIVWRNPGVEAGSTAAVPLDSVADASDFGAYRPNMKPGLPSDRDYPAATQPAQYGKQQWIRPLASEPEEVAPPSTQPVLLP